MKKVLFLANHFITLYSFRKELIKTMIDEGHEIVLSLPESNENKYFENLGCKIIPTEIDRRGVNPLKDLKLICFYKKMIREVDPDIIFSYTIKPNIYGTMASNGNYIQVCNITGTGSTFLKKNFVSEIAKFLYRHSVKKCHKVFFQNTGDRDYFIKNKLIFDNYDMLPGSGCNLEQNRYTEMPSDDTVRFIFIGRIMKLKGIDEYLQAAEIIKAKYSNAEFMIAGWNEEMEYQKIVSNFQDKNIVNYIGFRKDIDEWIKKCHCTVLPSHGGEGVPNALLESAATGRICIGSKINGTVEVIQDGVTGYLFEPANVDSLVQAIENVMMLSCEERRNMGRAGRTKIEQDFNRNLVIDKYMAEVNKI